MFDPISIGLGAVGLGMSLFGASKQASNAKAQAAVSMEIAKKELAINAEKQKAMELNGRRQQMEIFRNTQRARAQSLQAATTQGASFGSGLQGGLAEIASQGLFNLFGVNRALDTGRTIAGYNDGISQDKIKLAQLGGEAADSQIFNTLGGALMKIGPTVGPMFGGFGSSSGSKDYSGNPWSANTGNLY